MKRTQMKSGKLNTLPELKAFKRAPSLGLSLGKWESNDQPCGKEGHQRSLLPDGGNVGARN
jgi:hypothetical protein